ncbi:MAG: hypothetical protein G8345_03015, partial [Magnetococcales bacterium]|nr:hypothetical protein [Magnetococcales bacterium]
PEKNNNISIKYKVADKAIYDNLKEKCMDGLNVYCGTFLDGSDLDWSKRGPPQVGNLAKRGKEVFGHLEQARRLSAHVVLLPELTLPPVLRQEVACWLADHENPFCLVVPGSFHQMDKISQKWPVNRALLLDGKGRKIFSHDKIVPFGRGDENELIHVGNSLTLWDSPLGVMMLAICKDFLDDDDYLRLPWQSLAPDWMWVPSMSESTSAHERQMGKMVRCCETRTAIANQLKLGIQDYEFPEETFLFSSELTREFGKDYQMVRMAIPKEWQKK